MTIDDARALYALLAGFGAGSLVAGGVAFLLVRFYLSSYLTEKAKNLATREDIASITKEVESVRAPYAALVEEFKARHQLRLAAIDRRLQAHQEAFVAWRKLYMAVHTPEIVGATTECFRWWEQNCLYLEAQVREGLLSACSAAQNHASLLQDRSNPKAVKDNWANITGFPQLLFAAVQLPGLSDLEARSLKLTARPDGPPGG